MAEAIADVCGVLEPFRYEGGRLSYADFDPRWKMHCLGLGDLPRTGGSGARTRTATGANSESRRPASR